MRSSQRQLNELRPVTLERGVSRYAEGSCLVQCGNTSVLCLASFEPRVPHWLRGGDKGWVTAEYGMLPRATSKRVRRASQDRQSGRTMEIQRLISRSMRAVVDLEKLGERQIIIDCDVLHADGGTRSASITGAWVALHDCIEWMTARGILIHNPLTEHVAAVSCGLCDGKVRLDLDYDEDSTAHTDANFVMTGDGSLVEVQATAENKPFSDEVFMQMLFMARKGIDQLISLQKKVVS